MFLTSVGGSATFKEEMPAPREALIKVGCAKCWEGAQGKICQKRKKSSLKSVALAVLQPMWGRIVKKNTPESKKSSLKSVALVQQHKNEVPDK